MADLAKLAIKDVTFRMFLRSWQTDEIILRDDGEPMWVDVLSMDSGAYRKVERRINDATLKQVFTRRNTALLNTEKSEAQTLEKIAAAIVGWNIQFNGETPEPTPGFVHDLLSNPEHIYIKEQLDAAIHDRSNFTQT